jgi:hypothetical protein
MILTVFVLLGLVGGLVTAVHEILKRRSRDPRVNSFITAATFVPDMKLQLKRRALIREIGSIASSNRRVSQDPFPAIIDHSRIDGSSDL